MLVLSRKKRESVLIGSTIQVTVVSIGKRHVKLGISAPNHVRIIRNELIDCGPDADVSQAETSQHRANIHDDVSPSLH